MPLTYAEMTPAQRQAYALGYLAAIDVLRQRRMKAQVGEYAAACELCEAILTAERQRQLKETL